MNDTDATILRDALQSLNLVIEDFDRGQHATFFSENTVLFGWVSGGDLGDLRALIRAESHICKISLWIDCDGVTTPEQRLRLFEAFLQANTKVPLGRIGLFVSQQDQPFMSFAETMFFWHTVKVSKDHFDYEVRQRVYALLQLYHAALEKVAESLRG